MKLFPDHSEIDLIVAHVVVDELDEKKHDEKTRRRDRARAALKLIEQASDEGGLVLRREPFKLTLRVDAGDRIDWAAYPRLDPTRPDDQLVAAALVASGPRAVASHDRGPTIRARALGLEARRVPDDWMLPDEVTDKDKEIARLKREVVALSAVYPTIELTFDDWDDANARIAARAPMLPALNSAAVDHLTKTDLAKNPMMRLTPNLSRGIGLMAGGVTSMQVDEYESEYLEYAREVRRFFESLHETVRNAWRVPRIRYRLANTTTVTAQNLLFRFEVMGEAHLLVDRDSIVSWGADLAPPTPPEVPQNPWDLESSRMATNLALGVSRSEPRDPTGFYWQDRPTAEEQCASLLCAEFRAKEDYANDFGVLLLADLPYEGELQFTLSASNMQESVRRVVPFRVAEAPAAWTDADVLGLFKPWIADEIRRAVG